MDSTMSASIFGLGLCAYLLGAIPTAFLLARLRGVDIRKVGSGNVGATNVFRSVSKPLGVLTFVLDAAKGFVAAFVLPRVPAMISSGTAAGGAVLPHALLLAALAVVGHNWPIYLRFRGGKGVATAAGAVTGLAPAAALIGLLVWTAVFLLTRYVSVASVTAALLVPAAAWLLAKPGEYALPAVLSAVGLIIVWRHRSNLQRLRAGTEHRFEFRRRRTPETCVRP